MVVRVGFEPTITQYSNVTIPVNPHLRDMSTSSIISHYIGAEGGTRTHIRITALGLEASVYTNSTTSAYGSAYGIRTRVTAVKGRCLKTT